MPITKPPTRQTPTPRSNYLSRLSAHWIADVIMQWRQAANAATTGDAAVTYTECADALEAAAGIKFLTAICEGCGMREMMPDVDRHKVYPRLPNGWSECGQSQYRLVGHGKRLAAWCPSCRALNASLSKKGQ